MNGMEDQWHSGATRGHSPQNSCFATVRVDDVRPFMAKMPRQTFQRAPILQRMKRTNQLWNDLEQPGLMRKAVLEGSLRAFASAGDESNRDVWLLMEAKHCGNSIFLGAANDEPGDHVADAEFRDRAHGRD